MTQHVTASHDPVPGELTAAQDARYRQADAAKADEAKAAARSRARAVAARLAAAKPAPRPAPASPSPPPPDVALTLSGEEVHLLDHLLRTHPNLAEQ